MNKRFCFGKFSPPALVKWIIRIRISTVVGIFLWALPGLLTPSCSSGEIQMKPFVMEWSENSEALPDLSFLNEAPAGRDGYITIENGHFVKPNGERFRIWGINITVGACFPPKDMAPTVASYLARFGINCVRFHFLDSPIDGIFPRDSNNTRSLDPEQLDRLDFFISELKKLGIYSNLNLNTARVYREGDGVKDFEYIGLGKYLNYFNEHVLSLHKEYARQLLTHFNPYTQSEYRNEPAVIIVEIVNENSIIEAWLGRAALDGKNNTKHRTTWEDIKSFLSDLGKITWTGLTPGYASQLTVKYNEWLKENLSHNEMDRLRKIAQVGTDELIPRLLRDQIQLANPERYHWEAAFYMSLEKTFFEDMYRFLKSDLGVKSMIVGSADHGHRLASYAHIASLSQLDVIDGHEYWQLPRYISIPNSNLKRPGYDNSPMVNSPLPNSTVVCAARTAIAGKPYTVSEFIHPLPSEYSCEGIGIFASYAAFHDWDGVYYYCLSHYDPSYWKQELIGIEVKADPVTMTNLAAGALLFLRGDVKPANKTILRSYSEEQVIETFRLPLEYNDYNSNTEEVYFTPGFSKSIPLMHSTRIESLHGSSGIYPAINTDSLMISDTGELTWGVTSKGQGLVTIETQKSQALIGFVRDNPKILANLSASVKNEFCSIILTCLDGESIARANNLLLVTTSKVANTGQTWEEDRRFIENLGTAPTLIEPVTGKLILRNLEQVKQIEVFPLDGAGRVMGKAVKGRKVKEGEFIISVGDPATTWYLIKVSRKEGALINFFHEF